MTAQTLRITEIFHSIQGESSQVGFPTVFVRLTGCPLRCQYCDTAYAFHGGTKWPLADILEKIATYQCRHICVTGGEPLAQPNCIALLTQLCEQGYQVSLETSGALPIAKVPQDVMIILDLKTPDSQESTKNDWNNIPLLKPTDQIKFVLCSRNDYDWAVQQIHDKGLSDKAMILFSPSYQQLDPTQLAEWILQDRLNVRLQIQLHKFLWHDEPGR